MIILLIKLVLIVLCAILWRLGGAKGFSKGFRRFGCAGLITIAVIISQRYVGLCSIPFFIGSFSLGYGENSKLTKLLTNGYIVRAVVGLAYALSSAFILYSTPFLLGWHLFACTSWVCLAGNQRFKMNDWLEEGSIGLIVGLCPILGA